MKELTELINNSDPAWPIIKEWISRGNKQIKVHKADKKQCEEVLYSLQISTHSVLGAVAYECGGMIIDNGWIEEIYKEDMTMQ